MVCMTAAGMHMAWQRAAEEGVIQEEMSIGGWKKGGRHGAASDNKQNKRVEQSKQHLRISGYRPCAGARHATATASSVRDGSCGGWLSMMASSSGPAFCKCTEQVSHTPGTTIVERWQQG